MNVKKRIKRYRSFSRFFQINSLPLFKWIVAVCEDHHHIASSYRLSAAFSCTTISTAQSKVLYYVGMLWTAGVHWCLKCWFVFFAIRLCTYALTKINKTQSDYGPYCYRYKVTPAYKYYYYIYLLNLPLCGIMNVGWGFFTGCRTQLVYSTLPQTVLIFN